MFDPDNRVLSPWPDWLQLHRVAYGAQLVIASTTDHSNRAASGQATVAAPTIGAGRRPSE